MNPQTTITTDANGVIPIIAHHEKGGARPASLRLSCPVKLLKSARQTPDEKARKVAKVPCPFARVVKHSHVSVIVNFNYEGNVNAQRTREGVAPTFETEANWFEHITRAIVQHPKTLERYIFVRVLDTALDEPFLTDGEADGKPITRADVVPYLPADELSDIERAEAGLPFIAPGAKQELDKQILCITFKLANVREIKIDGFTYAIDPTVAPEPIEVTPQAVTTTKASPAVVTQALHRLALHVSNNPHAYEGQF